MIVFDTETTGLPAAGNAPLSSQPHIIEFAAIKLNDSDLTEVARIDFLCKPPVDITAEITKINGICDDDVKDKPPFSAHLKELQLFFLGEKFLCAHNVAFDRQLLEFELRRLGMMNKFPWPPTHICTVEQTYSIKGHRLNLMALHQHLFGEPFDKAHRAINDTLALVRCVRELSRLKKFKAQ